MLKKMYFMAMFSMSYAGFVWFLRLTNVRRSVFFLFEIGIYLFIAKKDYAWSFKICMNMLISKANMERYLSLSKIDCHKND